MNDQLKTGAERLSAASPEIYLGLLAQFALLVIAVLVRLPAHDGRPLWADELWRAMLVLEPSYLQTYRLGNNTEAAITSPLYALLMRTVSAFYVSTNTLRLSSFLPGVLAPVLAFALIRKANGGIALSFVGGLVFALNLSFASYSNELKPYVFEVLVHLGCLYVWWKMRSPLRPRIGMWAVCFLTLILALMATPNAIFILPAFGISLFLAYWIRRDTKSAGILAAGFVVLGIIVATMYHFFWRFGGGDAMISYWSPGFDTNNTPYLIFFIKQLFALWGAAFETLLSVPFEALLALAGFAGVLAWAVYMRALLRPPVRDILIFYGTLVVTLALVNFLQLWPVGVLRPDLFLYGHAIVFFFLLAAQVPQSRRAAQIFLLCAAALLLWQACLHDGRIHFSRFVATLKRLGPGLEQNDLVVRDFSYQGRIGKLIAADCTAGKKTILFTEGDIGMPIEYYTKYDTAARPGAALLISDCVSMPSIGVAYLHPGESSALLSKTLSGASDAWFLYSHGDAHEVGVLQQLASRFGRITEIRSYQAAGYFHLVTRPSAR